jgi:cell fate regulator YaaT (PSP1 superfamily)
MTALTRQTTYDPAEYVISVSFTKVGKLYHFDFFDYPDLDVGDQVIVETKMLGIQMGEIKSFKHKDELDSKRRIYNIARPASPADLLSNQQWKEREVAALIDCREQAAEMGGYREVTFVAAEYNFNGTLLTIFFSTEDKVRVNTHRLRNPLQRQLDTQIEFRQIGARDIAKLQDGFGACGIPRCCSTFLTDFSMVSINMAKAQGISLNPTEITGMCGRLRCCLSYEYEQYVEARRQLPRMRKRVGTPHGDGRVVEIHPLRDAVTVLVNDEFHIVEREELKPLEELEALKKAAASPCAKSEGGACDCGSKRPRGDANELMAEMGVDAGDSAQPEQQASDEGEEKKSKSSRRRRRNRNRRRGKGGQGGQSKKSDDSQ